MKLSDKVAELVSSIKFAPQLDMVVRIFKRSETTNVKPIVSLFDFGEKVYAVVEDALEKVAIGPDYNYLFNKATGDFARWGRDLKDDPFFSPIGPELADVEISIDNCRGGCSFCYKGNTAGPGKNMTLETWKTILGKFPRTLTQVAFGITDLDSNPEFMDILKYTRDQGIVPNFTTHGIYMTPEKAKEYASVCGAIAVSCYAWNKMVCYDTVQMLTDAGMNQVNIHCVVSHELMTHAMSVVDDKINDPRLKNLRAIVFLGLKPKGRAANKAWNVVPFEFYDKLVRKCLDNNVGFGFDSCSAPKFELTIKAMTDIDEKLRQRMVTSSESCEAYLFSSYVNYEGYSWACSFTEDEKGFSPINVLEAKDFLKDFWYHKLAVDFRAKCIQTGLEDGCRRCVVFPVINP